MTTASCKAKGRALQKHIRNAFLEIGKSYGLEDDDIKSTPMGCSGVDVQFSPAAKKLFGPIAVEAKNVERITIQNIFWDHAPKYKGQIPLMVHKKNGKEPLAILRFADYMKMIQSLVAYKQIFQSNDVLLGVKDNEE